MNEGRYGRQVALPWVGSHGQARWAAGQVEVLRADLAGWVCARYLAGAGVGVLQVPPELEAPCRAVRSDLQLRVVSASPVNDGWVRVGAESFDPDLADPVDAGSEAARWALLRLLEPSS
jgi:uncharacterized membrane protein YhdT